MNKYEKYITLVLIGFSVTTPCWADCDGGYWKRANTGSTSINTCTEATCNGRRFCISNQTMNWWSAMAWCKANGMQLVSDTSICPGTAYNARCANWRHIDGETGSGGGNSGLSVWTRVPQTTMTARVIFGLDANLGSRGYAEDGILRAACEEISSSN